jgi:hypothetical protein
MDCERIRAVAATPHPEQALATATAMRSLSCMLAGLLICAPIWAAGLDWQPHKFATVSIFFVAIVGVMWLYDEIREG